MKEEKKILKLTLKKQWFDMIASGVKKEEYREIKPYWIKRLYAYWGKRKYTPEEVHEFYLAKKESRYSWILQRHVCNYIGYDAVEFTNGYGKHRPRITFELMSIKMGQGNREWGAPLEDVFIIKLGKELNRTNTEKP